MNVEIEGVQVTADDVFDVDELKYYLDVAKSRAKGGKLSSVTCTLEDSGQVKVDYVIHRRKFERIRRITGYLTGTLDQWNDAKQAEERDRVKHDGRI